MIYLFIPYMAPVICPAIEPTVLKSPPKFILKRTHYLNEFVCQTECRAIANPSIQ